jgi:hypothetical protein
MATRTLTSAADNDPTASIAWRVLGSLFDAIEFLLVIAVVAVLMLGVKVRAAEPPEDVKLKARVALALAEAEAKARKVVENAQAGPVVAPAPRTAAAKSPKLGYSEGYKKATLDQMPLVIFVSCDLPAPEGAIASKASSFGETTGPAVLVGFPQGDRLYIDATLTGANLTAEKIAAAVKAAAKKIETPAKQMPGKAAPPPLNSQIRAVQPAGCTCGPGCACGTGKCPASCPTRVAAVTPGVVCLPGGS